MQVGPGRGMPPITNPADRPQRADTTSTRSSRLVTISSQVAIRRPRLWMTGPRRQVCATGYEDGAAEGSRSHDTSGTPERLVAKTKAPSDASRDFEAIPRGANAPVPRASGWAEASG